MLVAAFASFSDAKLVFWGNVVLLAYDKGMGCAVLKIGWSTRRAT